MECSKCKCCSSEAIYIEVPVAEGYQTNCTPCFVESYPELADKLVDYLDMKLNQIEAGQ